jgi:two-component system sensor histidine kinase TctE
VRTRDAGGAVVLEVEDDGQGMPPSEMSRVWDRFRRGSGAMGAGTGLGLAIVRDIARLHGGEAFLETCPGGRGVLARVRLPAGDQSRPEPVFKLS